MYGVITGNKIFTYYAPRNNNTMLHAVMKYFTKHLFLCLSNLDNHFEITVSF